MKKMMEALAGESRSAQMLKRFIGIILVIVFSLLFMNVMLNDRDGRNSIVSAEGSNSYSSSEKTDVEIRLENILECMSGVGDVEVMIKGKNQSAGSFLMEEDTGAGDVDGVIVVADGAKNAVTRSEIAEAVSTVCNISPSDVIVFEMREREHDPAGDAS